MSDLDAVTYVLTVRQPWADLIVAGVKDVENRSWQPPTTLPQWMTCLGCYATRAPGEPLADCACDYGYTADIANSCLNLDHSHEWVPSSTDTGADRVGPFPFTIAIHAAAQHVPHDADLWAEHAWTPWAREPLRLGVIVGPVTVTGAHHADECAVDGEDGPPYGYPGTTHCSRWAEPGQWHWTLTDAQALDTPIPAKGRLGLWKLDREVVA